VPCSSRTCWGNPLLSLASIGGTFTVAFLLGLSVALCRSILLDLVQPFGVTETAFPTLLGWVYYPWSLSPAVSFDDRISGSGLSFPSELVVSGSCVPAPSSAQCRSRPATAACGLMFTPGASFGVVCVCVCFRVCLWDKFLLSFPPVSGFGLWALFDYGRFALWHCARAFAH